MPSNKLSGEVKAFIVQRLARFDTPSEVAEAVRVQFGEAITRQVVQCYNPYVQAGARLSPKWRQLFDATRRACLEETDTIGISHRAVRLRKLERQVELAEGRGKGLVVAKLLKQAGQEMGAVYTSRRARSAPPPPPVDPRPEMDDRTRAITILDLLISSRKTQNSEFTDKLSAMRDQLSAPRRSSVPATPSRDATRARPR